MQPSILERLKTCQACRGLNDQDINRIATASSWRELQPDEELAWPGDSALALYIVTRGRLRVFRGDAAEPEKRMGYVNQGETVGQASFLSKQFDATLHIVADIASEVVVIQRTLALRLILENSRFRKNLLTSFGLRLENLLDGKPMRRQLKVVGVVATDTDCQLFLPKLCGELEKGSGRLALLTKRPEDFAALTTWRIDRLPDTQEEIRGHVQRLLADSDRVLIDGGLVADWAGNDVAQHLQTLINECDEMLWCLSDHRSSPECNRLLYNLVEENPGWKSRIVGVRIIHQGTTSQVSSCTCANLRQRDLLLPVDSDTTRPLSLWQQGMDRVVRHLNGVRIGLALGGGGARGLSHLGVLRTLETAGISVDEISGTSAGAMIGIGYAAGIPVDRLVDAFANDLQPSPWLERMPGGRRLYVLAKFRTKAWDGMLRKHYRHWTFDQLPIPVAAVVTDLVSGDQVIRDSGDVVEAILESINVPVLSEPLMKDGMILVDGGVVNNLPAELLSDRGAEFVIGVDASKEIPNSFAGNHSGMSTQEMEEPGPFETAYRVMDVSRRGIARLQMTFADLVIEPDTSAFDFADFAAAREIALAGEAATRQVLPRIRAIYDDLMRGVSGPRRNPVED